MQDKIEERGVRSKIREFLEERYKSVTVKKVMRIIDGFPSIESFCKASKTEWLLKYRASRPKSKFDLGVKVIRAIEETIAFVRDENRNAELDALAKKRVEEEKRIEEEAKNPKFTVNEMKSIVAMMELCDIAAIDLKGIKQFMATIDVKIKEQK